MTNACEKYKAIGEAVMKEYVTHRSKEIEVIITSGKILAHSFVSVGVHPIAIFTEQEMKQIAEEA